MFGPTFGFNNFNLRNNITKFLAVVLISVFLCVEKSALPCTSPYLVQNLLSDQLSAPASTLNNYPYVGLPPSVFKLIKTRNYLKLGHNCTLCSSTKSETIYFLQTCWQLGYLLAPCYASRSEHSILHQFRQLNDWVVRKIVPTVHLKVNFS